MTTKQFSPAQLPAQKLFAERARAGTLKKGKRKTTRKANPVIPSSDYDYVMIDDIKMVAVKVLQHQV